MISLDGRPLEYDPLPFDYTAGIPSHMTGAHQPYEDRAEGVVGPSMPMPATKMPFRLVMRGRR